MTSDVVSFYSDANVLITGATGFCGGLLIEKLLRVCDDIGKIYVIVRAKKGKDIKDRLDSLYKEPIFNKLHVLKPDFYKKVHIIEGDLSLDGLGLNKENRTLLMDKIDIVFHCAASLNMDAKLKDSVVTNIRGTSQLLDLCHEMPNLKSMVFVSTAYSNCTQYDIEEKVYSPPIHADTLMKLSEETAPEVLEAITPGLLQQWPNTYCFTKAVAEYMVKEKCGNLPVGIFRPSIVMNTMSEPIPGWISNVYGPVGIMVAGGAGLLRVFNTSEQNHFDAVPADLCVNSLICTAWEVNHKWEIQKENPTNSTISVYNYSAGQKRSLTWGEFRQYCMDHEYPVKKRIWVVTMILSRNKLYCSFLSIFLHYIPGLLVDTYLLLKGEKPRMINGYKKIGKFSKVISFFALSEWNIINQNVYSLWDRLCDGDKKLFPFNMDIMDKKKYIEGCCLGVKLYIFKESLDDAEQVKKSYNRLMKIHKTIKKSFVLLFAYLIYKFFSYLTLI